MKLLILTLDTRGDVQPFVALPRGLANAGHEAVLAAPHRFEGFVRDQGVPFAGIDDCWSVAAEGPGAGADILVHNGQVVVGQHVAEKLGIPAVLALPIPMYVPTREFPWAGIAIPRWWISALNRATFSRGEGPGDDVRPHRRQVARRWTCRDAVAGMIRAAAPTAHRRRCCTRSADMCCHGRRLAGCSHGDRLLLVPGRHRARAITSPCALKAA